MNTSAANIVKVDPVVVSVTDKTQWTFVEITTADGLKGVGEATLGGVEPQLVAAARQIGDGMMGRDAATINAFGPLFNASRGGQAERAVASACEQALWDLMGQRTDLPVHALLGGAVRDRVPVYANVNRRTRDRSPEGCAASARDAVDRGFGFIKIAPFDGVGEGEPALAGNLFATGLERIRAVRRSVGPKTEVMVDCHWRLDEAQASRLLEFAADLRLYWVECPLPETVDRLPALRRVRQAATRNGVRLAGLEMGTHLEDFLPYLRDGIYDVIMPDVKYCGGLAEMRHLAAVAAAHGVLVSPHNPSGPVCHMASLHAAAVISNFFMLEMQFDESPLFDELVGGALPSIEKGWAPLPQGPGLGCRLGPAVREKIEVTP